MAQVLDPLPPHCTDFVPCCYVNLTHQIQIALIVNVADWYFERVVFPGQRLLFEAPCEGELEIHASPIAPPVLLDRIPCQELPKYDTKISRD